jgi:outer membrane scaffolding protein for murein synthesis (MipA/OmpV family)
LFRIRKFGCSGSELNQILPQAGESWPQRVIVSGAANVKISVCRMSFAAAVVLGLSQGAAAGEGESWFSGDWYLTVGAAGFVAPEYEGAKDFLFRATPMISIGKVGPEARFTSRNDNISFSLFESGAIRAGAVGKIVFPRDGDDADDLKGLDPVRWGAEIGGFAEVYPTDWLRIRGEVRHGIRAHDGIVADISADAFHDVTPTIRVSGGPRASFASSDYFDTYYGVSADEAQESGLSAYDPGGGLKSLGVGGAVTWKTTDQVTTSLFGEYSRLMGSAKDSSLVQERGSPDQLMLGVSATYRFDFTM